MRFGFVVTNLAGGGAEWTALNIAAVLGSRGSRRLAYTFVVLLIWLEAHRVGH